MMKIITSYSVIKVPEGKRLSYTYSVIDETTGTIVKTNERASFAVFDQTLLGHIQAIEDAIAVREQAQ